MSKMDPKKIFLPVEVRNEKESFKKVDILVDQGFSKRQSLQRLRMDSSTYKRAKSAVEEGRSTHRNGQPPALEKEEMDVLISWINEQNEKKNSPTKKMVTTKVSELL